MDSQDRRRPADVSRVNPSASPRTTPIDDPGTFAIRMEALVRMSTALTGLENEQGLFEVARQYLDDIMPVGRATLGLIDDDGQLRVWGLLGSGVSRTGELLQVDGLALAEVIRTGRPLYGRVAADSPWPDHRMLAERGYGSALVVPLLTGGATIGTLNVARIETDGFAPDDIRLLEHAGRFLAVSILGIRRLAAATSAERASTLAHELAAQRVRDIETINRVFRLLDDVSPVDQRLARAARELGGLRGVDRCLLAVIGDDGELAPVVPPGGAPGRRRQDDAGQPDRRRSDDGAPTGAVDPWTTLRRAVAERRPIWEGSTGIDGSWQAGHLAVPIVVRDQVAGALGLVAQGGSLGASQGVLAETVAGQIANALERDLMFVELRRAAETADATSRARSQFLANMSHELRTPMNGVIGMTALLEGTELTPQQRGYVETIRISGEAQVAVINHILDFTKIEAARLELQISPFDLRTCVEDALDLAAATIGTKPVELSYEMAAELPDRYEGDGTRVRQVLINLVSNAVKFTERGEVTVRVAPDGPGRLRIAVTDTGVGIPPDRIEWLFEPFTQLAAAPGQGQGGSGLGLAISRQLVELMGGTIGATSEPGRGSTFEVVVPLPAAADVDASDSVYAYGTAVEERDDGLAGREVLVVGLAPGSRAALVSTLEGWGMTASTADDLAGLTGAGLTGAGPPDVALIDSRLRATVDGARWDRLADSLGAPVIPLCPVGLPPGAQPPGGPTSLTARPLKPSALRAALRTALGLAPLPHRADTTAGPPTGPAGGDGTGAPLLGETHPLRVLVAEDNRVNQKVALALLERLGYTADVAADGLEAVAAATLGPGYDLVLMDLKMPGIDGIEAARRIRRLLPRHAPRIVAMTADTIAVVRSSCLNVGMAGFVPKPVRMENLAEVLRNTPPSAPAPSVIDETALATLADLVSHDPTALDDIIGVWLADTPELVHEVQAAYQHGELAGVVEAVHPLVSSSATVGALTLSSLAASIEREARDGRMPTPVALAQLRLAADQAITALVRRQRLAAAG